MADPVVLDFEGDWRITVIGRNAAWGQRVAVTNTADGDRILAGNVGNTIDVFGNGRARWRLSIEHNDGSGWEPSWLRPSSSVGGLRYEYLIESEDITTSSSDRDFDDLVIRVEKLGIVAQPTPPFAIVPDTLQAMPEGVFEAALGRYFMAVRVQNIWTLELPPSSRVGLTNRCRSWLAAHGVEVIDDWPAEDQAALGQRVTNGRVHVGPLGEWESTLVYFKVNVTNATISKHQIELQVSDDYSVENLSLVSKKAKAPIFVSRTTYDPEKKGFVSESDVGILTAAIKEIVLDHSTFKRAMGNARRLVTEGVVPTPGTGGGSGSGSATCNEETLEWVRRQLHDFLNGKRVDICAVYRALACCCAGGYPGDGGRPPGEDPWTEWQDPGLRFFVWPSVIDYSIDYNSPFIGQFGPIPYEDPWWKVLLLIIAIILALAAAVSSVFDLALRSDDVVIGTLTRSIENPLAAQPATPPPSTNPGSIDAAVVTLNGNRDLTPAVFSVLDAGSGEFFTATPVVAVDAIVDTPGTIVTNAEIDQLFQNLAAAPGDPAAIAAMRAYKSGARSGLGRGILSSVVPVSPRLTDDGGNVFFLNQIQFLQDADSSDGLSCSGDSGSLWHQETTDAIFGLNHASAGDQGNNSTACRIEDVVNQLGIRFT